MAAFQRSVEHFQAGLKLDPSPDERADALVLCSDALQQWAQQVLEVEATLPDAEQSAAVEAAAKATAAQLLDKAVQVRLSP